MTGRRPGAGAAALAGGDEHHVGALHHLLDLLVVRLGGAAPDLGVAAGAEAAGEVTPDVELEVGVAHQQRLGVGVDGDELHALQAGVDHPVDGVDAAAADADDLDDGEVVLGRADHQRDLRVVSWYGVVGDHGRALRAVGWSWPCRSSVLLVRGPAVGRHAILARRGVRGSRRCSSHDDVSGRHVDQLGAERLSGSGLVTAFEGARFYRPSPAPAQSGPRHPVVRVRRRSLPSAATLTDAARARSPSSRTGTSVGGARGSRAGATAPARGSARR